LRVPIHWDVAFFRNSWSIYQILSSIGLAEERRMRISFIAISILLFLTLTIMPQTYPVFPRGEYWRFPDARTLGLAGAGSISNFTAAAIVLNPAALSKNELRLNGQFSIGTRKLEERRSYPIYNRIDDIVEKGTYVINNNWEPITQADLLFGLNTPYLKTIAIGMHEEMNQNYTYEEEVRENIFGDSLLAYNNLSYRSVLRIYGLAAGFTFGEAAHAGLQVALLNGNLDKDSSVVFLQRGYTDIKLITNRELDNTPIIVSFGAIYDFSTRISAGANVQLPYTLDYRVKSPQTDIIGNESIEYPMQLTAGLEYRAQQILQARLNIDFTYEWWSNTTYKSDFFEGGEQKKKLDDVIAAKVGIEHIFHNKIPFRVGFQFRTTYLERSTSRTLLTAGTGFMGKNWQVDASGGFSSLDYLAADLFDDRMYEGDRSNSPVDDVEETFFFGLLTLRFYLQK